MTKISQFKLSFHEILALISTGERNLISFLYRIYEFIGSDKQYCYWMTQYLV